MAAMDITGQRFGKLEVVGQDGYYITKTKRWLLRCDCGALTHSTTSALRAGQSKQCADCRRANTGTHRKRKSRLYSIWCSMKTRCTNPKHVAYRRYGGRGIGVCDEWQRFEPFSEWAEANGYAAELQLDRTDNNGGYSPENCRWVTPAENVANRECSK